MEMVQVTVHSDEGAHSFLATSLYAEMVIAEREAEGFIVSAISLTPAEVEALA